MAYLIQRALKHRLRHLILLAMSWCAVTGGVFSGCRGLFTPAVPEPPSGEPVVNHYATLDETFATMKLGIAAKGFGASGWLGAFDHEHRPLRLFRNEYPATQSAAASPGFRVSGDRYVGIEKRRQRVIMPRSRRPLAGGLASN